MNNIFIGDKVAIWHCAYDAVVEYIDEQEGIVYVQYWRGGEICEEAWLLEETHKVKEQSL